MSILYNPVLNGFSSSLEDLGLKFCMHLLFAASPILCDLVTLVISYENYKLLSSWLCNLYNSVSSACVRGLHFCPKNVGIQFLENVDNFLSNYIVLDPIRQYVHLWKKCVERNSGSTPPHPPPTHTHAHTKINLSPWVEDA